MPSDQIVFAGVDVSSGRKPVTLAALDEGLKILTLQRLTLEEFTSCLQEYETVLLAVNSSSKASVDFKKSISQSGFRQASRQSPRQWIETDTPQCFRVLCDHKLLSQRSLEGRIQRALLLYDERLQIPDPMDFFEEITRHKLLQGTLPQENTYSVHELDALMAAYVAWLYTNEPRHIHVAGNHVTLLRTDEE